MRTILTRLFDPSPDKEASSSNADRSPAVPETIDTDRQRLEQILKNLLSNALKFTEEGHRSAVRSRQAATAGSTFAVTDTGIGISEEQQQRVFEAFRQADGTPHANTAAQAWDCRFRANSPGCSAASCDWQASLDEGSTFTLSLPARS